MAIAFDAASGGSSAASNTLTFSHTTAAGSDRIIVVDIASRDPATTGHTCEVLTVTYNAIALTRLYSINFQSNMRQERWYLVAPATGANDVVITMAAAQTVVIGVSRTYTGVDQTNSWAGFASPQGGSGASTSTIDIHSRAITDLVLDALYVQAENGTPTTTGGNTSRRVESGAGGTGDRLAVSDLAGTGTFTTMSWTFTANKTWQMKGAALQAVGTGRAATTIVATDTSRANVYSKIEEAIAGDTVQIPAGTSVWTQTLRIYKAITLSGTGYNLDPDERAIEHSTIIQDAVTTDYKGTAVTQQPLIHWFLHPGLNSRLTGIEFNNGGRPTQIFAGIITIEGQTGDVTLDARRMRIDHCKFHNLFGLSMRSSLAYGVIDHNTINCTTNMFYMYTPGDYRWADKRWEEASNWGGENFMFLEDNTIYRNTTGAITDAYGGARYVARYNKHTNGHWDAHGTESAGRTRGTRAIEVYNNTGIGPFAGNGYTNLRSGTALVHHNTITQAGSGTLVLNPNNQRVIGSFSPFGIADGINIWDNNTAGNPVESRTATSGGTRSVTDTTASWTTDQWKGYVCRKTSAPHNVPITAVDIGTNRLTVTGHGLIKDSGLITLTVNATAKTVTRSSGSFLTDGFLGADGITFSGFTNAGNNGLKTSVTVTATVITLSSSTAGLVDETGDGDERAVTGSSPVAITNHVGSTPHIEGDYNAIIVDANTVTLSSVSTGAVDITVAGTGGFLTRALANFSIGSSAITSNTSNTLTLAAANFTPSRDPVFAAGDTFQITRITEVLDQPGMSGRMLGTSVALPVPNSPFDQVVDPIYEWLNTENGSPIHIGDPVRAEYSLQILEGTHFFNDTEAPGYTPYTYPHPLVSGAAEIVTGESGGSRMRFRR